MIDNEAKVKAVLMKHLRAPNVLPGSFVALRHEDRINAGGADISITGNMTTSWLEVKLADPYVRARGVQDLAMLRLGRASHAYYIIFYDKKGELWTHIVHPTLMKEWPDIDKESNYFRRAPGFNYGLVSDFILEIHRVERRAVSRHTEEKKTKEQPKEPVKPSGPVYDKERQIVYCPHCRETLYAIVPGKPNKIRLTEDENEEKPKEYFTESGAPACPKHPLHAHSKEHPCQICALDAMSKKLHESSTPLK